MLLLKQSFIPRETVKGLTDEIIRNEDVDASDSVLLESFYALFEYLAGFDRLILQNTALPQLHFI